jgi:hypothetical protein
MGVVVLLAMLERMTRICCRFSGSIQLQSRRAQSGMPGSKSASCLLMIASFGRNTRASIDDRGGRDKAIEQRNQIAQAFWCCPAPRMQPLWRNQPCRMIGPEGGNLISGAIRKKHDPMDLSPFAAMTYDSQALVEERVMRVGNTDLLRAITKNIRSLECAADKQGHPIQAHGP